METVFASLMPENQKAVEAIMARDTQDRFVGALRGVLDQKLQKRLALTKIQSVLTNLSNKKQESEILDSIGWGSW